MTDQPTEHTPPVNDEGHNDTPPVNDEGQGKDMAPFLNTPPLQKTIPTLQVQETRPPISRNTPPSRT